MLPICESRVSSDLHKCAGGPLGEREALDDAAPRAMRNPGLTTYDAGSGAWLARCLHGGLRAFPWVLVPSRASKAAYGDIPPMRGIWAFTSGQDKRRLRGGIGHRLDTPEG